MHLYKFVNIDNLEQLQKEVLDTIGTLNESDINLKMSYAWSEILSKNITLNKALYKLKLHKKIKHIGIITLPPDADFVIHHDSTLDSTGHKLSLNIPIANCNNTYTIFYESIETPVEQYCNDFITTNCQSYWQYDPSSCTEIARIEMNQPCLIDVSVPHNAINPTNKLRVLMLVRLSSDATV